MKRVTKKSSYGPWLIASISVLALAAVVTSTVGRKGRPTDGHAPVVVATGRSDASFVLDPARFNDSRQREAYTAAREIPAVLNQLYCWCGCKENPATHHRALLECFESEHGSGCDICMGEATIARSMVEQGVTDVRRIQDQIDMNFAPKPPGS
jgi:hypothetical protein